MRLLAPPQVPLDNVDLSRMSLLYTQGEMAAVTPIYDYDFAVRSCRCRSHVSCRIRSRLEQRPVLGIRCVRFLERTRLPWMATRWEVRTLLTAFVPATCGQRTALHSSRPNVTRCHSGLLTPQATPAGVQVLYGAAAESSWREILYWVGPPGMVIGLLALLTLDEPRSVGKGFMDNLLSSSRFLRAPG